MNRHPDQPHFNEGEEGPEGLLPDGTEREDYVKKDREWPNLERRLGEPRILNNSYSSEVIDWVQDKYGDNPDDFSYFEAGSGHGNDLRSIRKELNERGRYLGVDMSAAEIMHGLDYYKEQEDTEETRKLFAQGDLRDLAHIKTFDEEKGDFSKPAEIKDGEFDVVYMEAVLHGFGYGKDSHQQKKESAQQAINELYRICKPGGKFFGRAKTFNTTISKEDQHQLLRDTNNWRFVPDAEEFEDILKQAGFINIKKTVIQDEKADKDPSRKDMVRFSFLAEK